MSEAVSYGVVECRKCNLRYEQKQHATSETHVTCGGCGNNWVKDQQFLDEVYEGQSFLRIFSRSRDLGAVSKMIRMAEDLGTPANAPVVQVAEGGYGIDVPLEAVETRLEFAHMADALKGN